MVLDPKTGGSHNDYGSITEGCPESGAGTGEGEGAAGPAGSGAAPGMTQNDLYQRQPLLPVESWASKNGGGTGGGGGGGVGNGGGAAQSTHILAADFSEDDDDKSDGLKRNIINANGVVRIDMPMPLREEPRFPKEQFKTCVGQFN